MHVFEGEPEAAGVAQQGMVATVNELAAAFYDLADAGPPIGIGIAAAPEAVAGFVNSGPQAMSPQLVAAG
jgi:hypothetical protein